MCVREGADTARTARLRPFKPLPLPWMGALGTSTNAPSAWDPSASGGSSSSGFSESLYNGDPSETSSSDSRRPSRSASIVPCTSTSSTGGEGWTGWEATPPALGILILIYTRKRTWAATSDRNQCNVSLHQPVVASYKREL